jgi:hypothetical protein
MSSRNRAECGVGLHLAVVREQPAPACDYLSIHFTIAERDLS